MPVQTEQDKFKRHIAYKMHIGDILEGKPIFDEEKFKLLEYQDNEIVRVNVIANITDKFMSESDDKKFGSLTIDDASGQIKIKAFGEDIKKFEDFTQGDTIQLIGVLRHWNDELYIIPEIMKKREPTYLLVRKLELDLQKPKTLEKNELLELKDKIIKIIKREEANGGADTESLILELKSPPNAINDEIKKLLEEGIIYEPRPGKVRYLG